MLSILTSPLPHALHPTPEAPCDFTRTMATWAAYHGYVAQLVTEEIRRQFGLKESLAMHVATCLQEACMNALIHGNLEVASPLPTLASFDAYYALIETRLNEEPYQGRRLTVRGWNKPEEMILSVSDEGKGIVSDKFDETLPEGRGLSIIGSLADQVWIGADRRTLFMKFSCPR